MKMCPDGDSCHTWFIADGSLICRHGLVAKSSKTTSIGEQKCPAKMMYDAESKMLREFIKGFPKSLHKGRNVNE